MKLKKPRLLRRHRAAPGAQPGTLVIHADAVPPSIDVISFNETEIEEEAGVTPDRVAELLRPDRVVWVDVQGLGDAPILRQLGELFSIHRLALADVVNLGQRPKTERYDDLLFTIVRMVQIAEDHHFVWEQVSVFCGRGFVLTFQETKGDCLDPVRKRLRRAGSVIRASASDYLATMVIDAIVDGYFPVIEYWGEHLEDIEARVVGRPGPEVLAQVYAAKRELMTFRRAAWPLRDAISQLARDPHPVLHAATMPYVRDINDHLMQVVDVMETYRELAGSFVDVYLSSLSNRTNEVMRVLTVLSSIFIPLTFIAGVYGMNFDTSMRFNLPELRWRYGYPAFLAVCVVTATTLLIIFRRIGWLGQTRARKRSP